MTGVLIILGIAAILLVWKAVVVVPPRNAFVVTRLGRPVAVLHAGLNFLIPVVDVVSQRYSLDEQQLSLVEAFRSRDDERIQIEARVRYRIVDPRMAFERVSDVDQVIRGTLQASLRAETEQRTGSVLRDDRRGFRQAVAAGADRAASQFGAKILECEIDLPRGF